MRARILVVATLSLSAGACAAATPNPAAPEQATVVDLRPPPAPAGAKAQASGEPAAQPEKEGDVTGKEAVEFGMIGLLNGGAEGNEQLGAIWGDSIGEAFGAGGLGLSGSGAVGPAPPQVKPPQVKMGATSVSGRLPPEVIQRIVRQNFGRYRLCYEKGLQKDPALEGKVSVRFIIDKDGSIKTAAADAGTTMPDTNVTACVIKAFSGLTFPPPEGGTVSVVYPLLFKPAAPDPPAAAPVIP